MNFLEAIEAAKSPEFRAEEQLLFELMGLVLPQVKKRRTEVPKWEKTIPFPSVEAICSMTPKP